MKNFVSTTAFFGLILVLAACGDDETAAHDTQVSSGSEYTDPNYTEPNYTEEGLSREATDAEDRQDAAEEMQEGRQEAGEAINEAREEAAEELE